MKCHLSFNQLSPPFPFAMPIMQLLIDVPTHVASRGKADTDPDPDPEPYPSYITINLIPLSPSISEPKKKKKPLH